MGASWQNEDHKVFFNDHLPSYSQHLENDTLNSMFWPDLEKSWFEKWPVPEPAAESIQKEGDLEKARKAERAKQFTVSTFYSLTRCVNSNLLHHPESQACLQNFGRS